MHLSNQQQRISFLDLYPRRRIFLSLETSVVVLLAHPSSTFNMSQPTLNYKPSWYHLGDADESGMALAYGVLALGTIFLIEYIFSSLLFSDVEGISLSDAAALITCSDP